MATASTKSRGNKRKGRQANVAQQLDDETETDRVEATLPTDAGGELSTRAWWIASAAVMLVAALVRLYQLGLRPMHHDEGVNGFFLFNLMRPGGVFRYDPSNYHGPTLYYFALPLAAVAERWHIFSEWTVRLVPLIFGLATIWLVLSLRRYLGSIGALAAGALLALSPGFVFFSRYFIHEMMFVFFTLGIVVAALRFYDYDAPRISADMTADMLASASPAGAPPDVRPGLGIAGASLVLVAASLVAVYQPKYYPYALALVIFSFGVLLVLLRLYDGGRSTYLALGAVSAALLFATKETAFISIGVLLIAWAMACNYTTFAARMGWFDAREPAAAAGRRGRSKPGGKRGAIATSEVETRGLRERLGSWQRISILFVAALGLFLFVNVLFYSSFFANPKGVWDAVKAYNIWQKTGQSGFHGYGWYKYFQWLVIDKTSPAAGEKWEFGEEPMLLLLASAGALIALWTTRRRFPLFAALWGFGLLAAYSIIKYKTPWLVLSMLVPFALTGGYAVDWLYRKRDWGFGRALALALLGFSLAVAAYQTYHLNLVHYDNDRYVYVYAHTKREYVDLINEVERIAARAGTNFDTHINVAAPEYWPMPWYFRNYKNVGYQGRVIQTTTDAVIISSDKQQAEIQATHGARYQLVGTYPMRPGVTLMLHARRDLVRP